MNDIYNRAPQSVLEKELILRQLKRGTIIQLITGDEVEFVEMLRTNFVFLQNGKPYKAPASYFSRAVRPPEKEPEKIDWSKVKQGTPFYIDRNGYAELYFFVQVRNGKIIGKNPITGVEHRIDPSFDFYLLEK